MNTYNSIRTPIANITDAELEIIILKMGSFLSIISNKKINQAKLLIAVIENKYFRSVFQQLTEIDNAQLLVRSILDKYPTICKSKIVLKSLVDK